MQATFRQLSLISTLADEDMSVDMFLRSHFDRFVGVEHRHHVGAEILDEISATIATSCGVIGCRSEPNGRLHLPVMYVNVPSLVWPSRLAVD